MWGGRRHRKKVWEKTAPGNKGIKPGKSLGFRVRQTWAQIWVSMCLHMTMGNDHINGLFNLIFSFIKWAVEVVGRGVVVITTSPDCCEDEIRQSVWRSTWYMGSTQKPWLYLPFLKIPWTEIFISPQKPLHNWEAFPRVQLKLLTVCLFCFLLLSTLLDRESSAAFLENPSDTRRKYFEFQFNSNHQLQIGTCRLPLQGLNHAAADFQHPLEGVQGGEQKWGPLYSGKNWQDRSSDRYFQELIIWVQFCSSSYLEKHWNPSQWWLFLVTSKSVMRLIETVWKNMCLVACTSPSPESHDLPPCLFGAVSQSYLRCCLPSCSPYLAPNKI